MEWDIALKLATGEVELVVPPFGRLLASGVSLLGRRSAVIRLFCSNDRPVGISGPAPLGAKVGKPQEAPLRPPQNVTLTPAR